MIRNSQRPARSTGRGTRRHRGLAALAAAAVVIGTMSAAVGTTAAAAPTGNGLAINAADLAFILKQIRIAERHAATQTSADLCGTLVGPAEDQIPDRLTAYGLRTVDGSCNNLFAGREHFAAADQPFPRLTTSRFREADPITPSFPVGPPGPTSYAQKTAGNVVVDSQPRVISNLIVDQTATNPAAVQAAGFPVRSQGNEGLFPCGIREIQLIKGTPTGTFFITIGTQTTGPIPAAATNAQIKAAVEALPSIGADTVVVNGSLAAGLTLSFDSSLGDVPPLSVSSIAPLTITTTMNGVAPSPGSSETQLLLSETTSPDFVLTFDGADTAPILADATDAAVQSALEAIPAIGPGGVTVTGGTATAGLTITFTAHADVPLLTSSDPAVQVTPGVQGAADVPAVAEVQSIEGDPGRTFTLDFGGDVTGTLPRFATAAEVAAALNALSPTMNVTVTGGPLGTAPIEVTFNAPTGDVAQLAVPNTGTVSGVLASTVKDGSFPNEPGCIPQGQSLFIPNITTDVGLSPPYNSMFTFFGQFFDHGVDQTVKSRGTVFVPLKADDPLRTVGPDGIAGNGDEVPASQAFMVLTRAQNQPGPDGILGTSDDIQDTNNTDSPWVDQSQTYTSHSSHQVFLREYVVDGGDLVSTGKFLDGLPAGETYAGSPDGRGGISTWASVKKQAHDLFGMQLTDLDALNVPMLAADPYGNFVPGPHGLPQYVTKGVDGRAGTTDDVLVEGNLTSPVPVPSDVASFDTPFLTDIAHSADPSPQDTDHNPGTPPVVSLPDDDDTPGDQLATPDCSLNPAFVGSGPTATGCYDDELLASHFACGDGRCNENIALSAVHQIFHSEHNRLVGDLANPANGDPENPSVLYLLEQPGNEQLKADFLAPHPFDHDNNPATADVDISFGTGGRLFQAARFITEMEYQHLVFEEFGRKLVPAIRPFHVYNPDVNPATVAEFAHAVYRFGHSMLDDEVARTSTKADGSTVDNSLSLIDAFLSPPQYFDNQVDPEHPVYTAEEAAGAIIMGSSDQVGNELDEFIVEALRNNLLGLPLDLATLNMTRARDAGVRRLNEVRDELFNQTGDGALAPYTSWAEFGQNLKHPESLVNFVAAYGKHPSITSAPTADLKRAAARAIVDPQPEDVPPADFIDFLFGSGDWEGVETGLNDVDLWVGGLAEKTNLFGGLLGSTFTYVFQSQMEKFQDFDRLYYLNRTPGMNLRTQLEGNSFSEMIQRNTVGTNTLKADPFATADCEFQLKNLSGSPAGFTQFGQTVADDPATECSETALLLRESNGRLRYRATNSVDPAGINGQSIYNGVDDPAFTDRVFGGNDNDTFWGNRGNDVIDGGGGDDVALGGAGDDIITDFDGADVPKGGPGNDAIDAGPGDDIPMGNAGNDYINGGQNDNETFAGDGNDWLIAGAGADAAFGDGGDDWIQGGSGQDLLIGDHAAPFFDDPGQAKPGNDIFVGQVGENDYDAEGGDDLMSQNSAVDRNAGAAGFDWAFHQYDTVGADDDMEINNNLAELPLQVVVNRDRWQETEGDSGSAFNDSLKGTSLAPGDVAGAGFSGCNALDPTGVARIAGLDQLVTTFPRVLATIVAASPGRYCPLAGDDPNAAGVQSLGNGQGNVWAEGDILIGGAGSDLLTGRGADDILDGDRFLRVRISVRANRDGTGAELGWTDLLEATAKGGSFGAGTAGKTLQASLLAGLVNPGQLVAVREIVRPTVPAADCEAVAPVNCDKALFTGPLANYSLVPNPDGSWTVTQTGANVAGQRLSDGVDTLRNIEVAKFSDGEVSLVPTASVTPASLAFGSVAVSDTSAAQTVTVTNTGLRVPITVTGVTVTGANAGDFTATSACTAALAPITPPDPGGSCTVTVSFKPTAAGPRTATLEVASNANGSPQLVTLTGTGIASNPPVAVTFPVAPTVTGTSVTVPFSSTPAFPPIQGFTADLVAAGTTTPALVHQVLGANETAASFTGLAPGDYEVIVTASNLVGPSPAATSATFSVRTAPTVAPATVTASVAGVGAVTVSWFAVPNTVPANGNSPITGYSVQRVNPTTLAPIGAPIPVTGTSTTVTGLGNGTAVRFQVSAVNALGTGPATTSATVTTPTAPAAPAAPTVVQQNGSLRVNWVAPNNGGSAITSYTVITFNGAGNQQQRTDVVTSGTTLVVPGLALNTTHQFRVTATNAVGTSTQSGLSGVFRVITVPTAPLNPNTNSGIAGGAVTFTANWNTPNNTGGTGVPITGYTVTYFPVNGAGVQNGAATTVVFTGTGTSRTITNSVATPLTTNARYRFTVTASNAAGAGPASAPSTPQIGAIAR